MKVLVFGDWDKRKTTYAVLDQLDKEYAFTTVIDGMASGTDEFAFDWALIRGVKTERYAEDWDAGSMLPDLAVAFPGGTSDMTRRCEKAGILVKKVTIK